MFWYPLFIFLILFLSECFLPAGNTPYAIYILIIVFFPIINITSKVKERYSMEECERGIFKNGWLFPSLFKDNRNRFFQFIFWDNKLNPIDNNPAKLPVPNLTGAWMHRLSHNAIPGCMDINEQLRSTRLGLLFICNLFEPSSHIVICNLDLVNSHYAEVQANKDKQCNHDSNYNGKQTIWLFVLHTYKGTVFQLLFYYSSSFITR